MPTPAPPLNEDARRTLIGKRFTAALIDGVLGIAILGLGGFIHERVGLVLCALYFLVKDGLALPQGRSLGKRGHP